MAKNLVQSRAGGRRPQTPPMGRRPWLEPAQSHNNFTSKFTSNGDKFCQIALRRTGQQHHFKIWKWRQHKWFFHVMLVHLFKALRKWWDSNWFVNTYTTFGIRYHSNVRTGVYRNPVRIVIELRVHPYTHWRVCDEWRGLTRNLLIRMIRRKTNDVGKI